MMKVRYQFLWKAIVYRVRALLFSIRQMVMVIGNKEMWGSSLFIRWIWSIIWSRERLSHRWSIMNQLIDFSRQGKPWIHWAMIQESFKCSASSTRRELFSQKTQSYTVTNNFHHLRSSLIHDRSVWWICRHLHHFRSLMLIKSLWVVAQQVLIKPKITMISKIRSSQKRA